LSKISNGEISLNWWTIDEVTIRNTTAYIFDSLCRTAECHHLSLCFTLYRYFVFTTSL